jgi:hypothetical protein
MLTNKTTFRNCLVVMCPKTKVADLPTLNDLCIYLRNAFVQRLDQLKQDIKVRILPPLIVVFTSCAQHMSYPECPGEGFNHCRWLDS